MISHKEGGLVRETRYNKKKKRTRINEFRTIENETVSNYALISLCINFPKPVILEIETLKFLRRHIMWKKNCKTNVAKLSFLPYIDVVNVLGEGKTSFVITRSINLTKDWTYFPFRLFYISVH